MGNINWYLFRNTLKELRACYHYWDTIDDNDESELNARKALLEVCRDIVENYGDDL